jgi:hypothetical protein
MAVWRKVDCSNGLKYFDSVNREHLVQFQFLGPSEVLYYDVGTYGIYRQPGIRIYSELPGAKREPGAA